MITRSSDDRRGSRRSRVGGGIRGNDRKRAEMKGAKITTRELQNKKRNNFTFIEGDESRVNNVQKL